MNHHGRTVAAGHGVRPRPHRSPLAGSEGGHVHDIIAQVECYFGCGIDKVPADLSTSEFLPEVLAVDEAYEMMEELPSEVVDPTLNAEAVIEGGDLELVSDVEDVDVEAKFSQSAIPTYKDYMTIVELNYNVKQLKKMCKLYRLKISGCKNELKYRLFNFMRLSYYAQKIQSNIRGKFVRTLNVLKGPAYKNRECVNDTDFLMFEKIKTIPNNQFFSYKDNDGFVYGFNICSIYIIFVEFLRSCRISRNL